MSETALDLAHRFQAQQEAQQGWARQRFGIMEDGHFMAVAINDRECVLAPYPEFAACIYRGQSRFYEPCRSSLYRTAPNRMDRFIAEMRVAEFQFLLSGHPAVVDFSTWSVMGLGFRIDYEGLAQHYGLQTQLIDFTSNPFVAAFFACCEYDRDVHEYRPIRREAQEGVMYSYFAADIGDPDGPEEPLTSIVGLQPLSRPAEQYAWSYRLPKRASLNSLRYITRFSFVHKPEVATRLFEHFEGGKKLFPYDPVAEKARQILASKELSREAFRLVLARHQGRMKEMATLNALKRKGIEIIEESRISFTSAELEEIAQEWRARRPDLESRIHYRRACYPMPA